MPSTTLPTEQPTTRAAREPRTIAQAREAFVASIRRDTPGTDLPRYVAVLDALLAWSNVRAGRVAFRAEPTPGDAISFGRVGTKSVLWSVRPVRGAAPALEIAPPTGSSLSAAGRARAMEVLNAHSRTPLLEGDRLRIGFGALKNVAARAAVLALLEELLASGGAAEG